MSTIDPTKPAATHKPCDTCGLPPKPLDHFPPSAQARDGRSPRCSKCTTQLPPVGRVAGVRGDGRKWCRMCETDKPLDDFGRFPASPDGRNGFCAECIAARKAAEKAAKDAAKGEAPKVDLTKRTLLLWANKDAIRTMAVFDLKEADVPPVPDVCPALGTEMGKPRLVPIVRGSGFTAGNVAVVSKRAADLLGVASAEDLLKAASWYVAEARKLVGSPNPTPAPGVEPSAAGTAGLPEPGSRGGSSGDSPVEPPGGESPPACATQAMPTAEASV